MPPSSQLRCRSHPGLDSDPGPALDQEAVAAISKCGAHCRRSLAELSCSLACGCGIAVFKNHVRSAHEHRGRRWP
ncbi:hypothetical protein EVAR_16488_1 [Eumeta japonica]|uniref:Uncharacterized protein n=1 Tax=Eumeta variegata TaxID=151549 RepID=A0A4C1ULQ5_EUMVA|nr:hypothetical protein EVAR_16488_1 [Eumeta japonica]